MPTVEHGQPASQPTALCVRATEVGVPPLGGAVATGGAGVGGAHVGSVRGATVGEETGEEEHQQPAVATWKADNRHTFEGSQEPLEGQGIQIPTVEEAGLTRSSAQ